MAFPDEVPVSSDDASHAEAPALPPAAPLSPLRPPRKQVCLLRRPFFWPACLGLLLLALGTWSNIFSIPQVWAAPATRIPPAVSSTPIPHTLDPTTGSTSLTQLYQPGQPGTQPAGPPQVISHGLQHEAMQPGSVTLQVGKATRFVGSDGRLDLQIPAGAITAAQLQAAGGTISLYVTQIAPASGSSDGGQLSLGSYLLQLVDAHGALLSTGLSKAITILYHLQPNELALGLSHPYVLFNGTLSNAATTLPGTVKPATGKTLASTLGKRSVQPSVLNVKAQTLTVTPLIGTPSTSLSWNSDAPIASFGKPNPFSTDLSAGGLTSSEPISVPAGPGGLTPPVNLTYSSEAVNGQHAYSSAAGWAGEGWNLSLGEITWSQHNVVAGCTPQPSCGTNWQNQWFLNDPYGTSSELIPPTFTTSTYYDASGNNSCSQSSPTEPCPTLWHTATESHAKIYSYVGNVSIPSESINPPCWRVWLPNGIMEEFGCTSDSIQYFYVPGGHAEVSGWFLDLITDPQGNQIHLTYQSDSASWTDPTTHTSYGYPRDVELSTIQYDSPGCHNAQAMCTGSSWAPLMQVVFNAGHNPGILTGAAPSGCNTGSNLRCDDPVDLSGSGGTAAPLIQNTFVLNTIQTQVRSSGSGSWNTLTQYNLGYEQSGPSTITDPASGMSASTAGMLDLMQFQQVGSTSAHALLYSGYDQSTSTSYAYTKLFDLSSQSITIQPSTTLSYWIYPQSHAGFGSVTGTNSTCVAVDLVFSDGSYLRDSGATDQNGTLLHPRS